MERVHKQVSNLKEIHDDPYFFDAGADFAPAAAV